DAGPAGALLLPKLFARAAHFALVFRLMRAGPQPSQVMPHRFVQQAGIYLRAEYVIGQLELAHCFAGKIFYVHYGHRRLFFPPVIFSATNRIHRIANELTSTTCWAS